MHSLETFTSRCVHDVIAIVTQRMSAKIRSKSNLKRAGAIMMRNAKKKSTMQVAEIK